MLYLILIAAFFGFSRFHWPLLSALRGAVVVATLCFALFVAQPVYRMQVLHEPPGQAIANSKALPFGVQFFPYLNATNLIFGGPFAGSFLGPCVHYTHYQQKLMDLFGVQSTAIAGYSHCALQFTEKGRVYMTDNGFWYKEIVFIGDGNWSPEGPDKRVEIPGHPSPLTPFLFPIVMIALFFLSYLLEMTLFGNRRIPSPFRSTGAIRIMPGMTECFYRKAGNRVTIDSMEGPLMLEVSEVEVLLDAPDIFYHPELGHFQVMK